MMQPYQLTPRTFAERMKGIDLALSETIFEELKAVEIIRDDNQSHFGWYESWCAFATQAKRYRMDFLGLLRMSEMHDDMLLQ